MREDQEHVTHCEGYEDLKTKANLKNQEELVQFFTRVMERRHEMNWDKVVGDQCTAAQQDRWSSQTVVL